MTDGDRGDIVGEQITTTTTAVATAAALLPGGVFLDALASLGPMISPAGRYIS